MKKFLFIILAVCLVMSTCISTISVVSAEVSAVNLPTQNGEYIVFEAEDYIDNISIAQDSLAVSTATFDIGSNTATEHSTPKTSGGECLYDGNVTTSADNLARIVFPITVEKETEYTLETVAGKSNNVHIKNYFELDNEKIFQTNMTSSTTTVAYEALGWKIKNGNNSDYYEMAKFTTQITIPAGNHEIAFVIPTRQGNYTYGAFALDYIKLTSCAEIVEEFSNVTVDNNFTRFEMLESFTNGETKTIKFTPSRTANYSLSVGVGAYNGEEIKTDISSLSFTVQDEEGTKIIENLTVAPGTRNINRVGSDDFTADNLALEAGKEYTISVTATLASGKETGSISYIDLRCLTLDIGTEPALISVFDFSTISKSGGSDSGNPNSASIWNKVKWSDIGLNPIGNYMDERLDLNNQLTTAIRNFKATYNLNIKENGKYKVRLYGLNLSDIAADGTIGLTAGVAIDDKSLGTAYYDNQIDDIADKAIAKRTLAPMDCPETLYLTAGTHDLVVSTSSFNSLDVVGIVVEKIPGVSFVEQVITDETTTVTANANYKNRTDEWIALYVALYDMDGRLLDVEYTYSTNGTDALSETITLVPGTQTAKAFVWNDELQPIYDSVAISKCSQVITCWGDSLTKGVDGFGTNYPDVLGTMVGSDYTVMNMGVGGETAYTIAARQGGIPMQVNEFVIPAGTENVEITFANDIKPLLQQGNSGINPCYINGIEGTISYEGEEMVWEEGVSKYYFSRTNEGIATAVAQGSIVETAAMRERKNDTLILWIGTNGPRDAENLINIQKKMIAQNNSENYLVVGLTLGSELERAELDLISTREFGDKYLNLRKYLSNENTLKELGITPTEDELSDIRNGRVPDCFHYDDEIHLNAVGYTAVAKAIYERIMQLGYIR